MTSTATFTAQTFTAHLRRALLGLIACVAAIVACTALSLFLGSTSASAAEPLDLVDGLTSSITDTAEDAVEGVVAAAGDTVSETVMTTVEAATEVANEALAVTKPVTGSATTAIEAVPVVDAPVDSVVGEAAATSTEVIAPLAEAISPVTDVVSEPLGTTTEPALEALAPLPIVGDLVKNTATSAVSLVDNVRGAVLSGAETSVEAIVDGMPLVPDLRPTSDTSSDTPSGPANTPVTHARADQLGQLDPVSELWRGLNLSESFVALERTPPTESAALEVPSSPTAPGHDRNSYLATLGLLPANSSASSGNASGAMNAYLNEHLEPSPHSEGLLMGAAHHALPPSPVYDTDASPD